MIFKKYADVYPNIALGEVLMARNVELNETYFEEIVFHPFYCADKNCDCRRTIVYVYERGQESATIPLAVISYGWEDFSFYRRWSKYTSDEELRQSRGPSVDLHHKQSHPDPCVVDLFQQLLDLPSVGQRFRRQYAQFKLKIGMKLPKDIAPHLALMKPCDCQSDKLFKFCCAPKNRF
jgi:hypothetical protein